AEIVERVGARALVADLEREVERALAPDERLLEIFFEHRELRDLAVGPRQLRRLAEGLEDRDRLARTPARGGAVTRVPVKAGEDARAASDARPVLELPVELDRALDRRERMLEPVGDVRGGGKLLDQGGLLRERQTLREVSRAPIVGVRLAVRL